jgi:hypothetical protein
VDSQLVNQHSYQHQANPQDNLRGNQVDSQLVNQH